MKLEITKSIRLDMGEWVVDILKVSEELTKIEFIHKDENILREYELLTNIISINNSDIFNERFDLYSKDKSYHINLSEQGCIIGDEYSLLDGEHIVAFACYDINDDL